MDSKSDRGKTFFCPYCELHKDKSELNYNIERSGFRPYLGKLNRPVSHNTYIWEYEKREIPICDDCLIKLQEAKEKATWIAVGIFIPIVLCFLYYILKDNGDFVSFIIPTGLVAVVCYFIKWILTKILSAKRGIVSGSHSSYYYSSPEDDPLSKYLRESQEREIQRKEEEEKRNKEFEEWRNKQEEWDKTHKIVEVDMGGGKVGYISARIPLTSNDSEDNEEYRKIKKFEEGASIDYSDDDFEGNFV